MAQSLGLPPAWGTFLAAVAHHESRWHSTAHNKSKSEVAASRKAWERNRAHFAGCGIPDSDYWIGSGGWYGLLPANAIVSTFRGTAGICTPPSAVFDPRMSTILAMGYARALMGWTSYKNSPQTWLNLNRGWAAPGKMNDALPRTDARFFAALKAMGVPASFASERVVSLGGWSALLQAGRA
jgi:hypothetical protein